MESFLYERSNPDRDYSKLNSLTAAIFIGEGEKADAATTVDARIRAVVFMMKFNVMSIHNGIRRQTSRSFHFAVVTNTVERHHIIRGDA